MGPKPLRPEDLMAICQVFKGLFEIFVELELVESVVHDPHSAQFGLGHERLGKRAHALLHVERDDEHDRANDDRDGHVALADLPNFVESLVEPVEATEGELDAADGENEPEESAYCAC